MTKPTSNFYVRSGLFGVLSLVGAAINYALYPILVRVLTPQEFGDFAAIVALSNQVLGVLLAFNITSIYLVKTLPEEKARRHAQVIQRVLIWFLLLMVALLTLASPLLNSLLRIESIGLFILLAGILVAAVPGVIWTGYLQGHKEMVRIGIYNVASATAKLIFATLLAIKFSSFGGVAGLFGGAAVGLVVLSIYPGVKLPRLLSVFNRTTHEERQFLRSLKGYIIECIFVVGVLSFLQNYDITLAKALFNPTEAGIYSGVSILSNALYYLSFLLIWIIMPEIDPAQPAHNKRVLGTAYKLLAGLAVITLVGEYILRDLITKILLGGDFSQQGWLLIFASLYQLTMVAITLYAFYLLVVRKKRAGLLAMIVGAGTLTVPAIFAQSPLQMIQLLWLSAVGSFMIYWVLATIYVRRRT